MYKQPKIATTAAEEAAALYTKLNETNEVKNIATEQCHREGRDELQLEMMVSNGDFR